MNDNHLRLYHTGNQIITAPDIYFGRSNADFGQGFYLSDSLEFSEKWAHEKKDAKTYVNIYSLDCTGLAVKRMERSEEWFDYIFRNRAGYPDSETADVIIGPIANDTIYDTYGLITSGIFQPREALVLLKIGPEYIQVALKTERAAAALQWLTAKTLTHGEITRYRAQVRREEEAYQTAFMNTLATMPGFEDVEELLR